MLICKSQTRSSQWQSLYRIPSELVDIGTENADKHRHFDCKTCSARELSWCKVFPNIFTPRARIRYQRTGNQLPCRLGWTQQSRIDQYELRDKLFTGSHIESQRKVLPILPNYIYHSPFEIKYKRDERIECIQVSRLTTLFTFRSKTFTIQGSLPFPFN